MVMTKIDHNLFWKMDLCSSLYNGDSQGFFLARYLYVASQNKQMVAIRAETNTSSTR